MGEATISKSFCLFIKSLFFREQPITPKRNKGSKQKIKKSFNELFIVPLKEYRKGPYLYNALPKLD
tara:strand:+ start:1080 stop:1277 length:198 start_codon:yes stop_codon:yes gene_type:complete